jgi:hypothetical protein
MKIHELALRQISKRVVLLVATFALSLSAVYCFTASSLGRAEATTPRTVEEIKTPGDASAFLQRALKSTEWVTSQRDFQQSPVAQLAHQQAVDTLKLAIRWLDGKTTIKAARQLTPERQKDEQSLLGVWRHRLNVDGTENVMVFGPDKSFVAVRGPQVWVGNWERRGDLLYTQNDRGAGDQFLELNLPDIQRISTADNGSITLTSISHGDHPGFTLERIR